MTYGTRPAVTGAVVAMVVARGWPFVCFPRVLSLSTAHGGEKFAPLLEREKAVRRRHHICVYCRDKKQKKRVSHTVQPAANHS